MRKDPNKITNEKREITTNTRETQMIIREHYEKLNTNKLDNLEKIDKFLETEKLPELNQKEMKNMNKQITSE